MLHKPQDIYFNVCLSGFGSFGFFMLRHFPVWFIKTVCTAFRSHWDFSWHKLQPAPACCSPTVYRGWWIRSDLIYLAVSLLHRAEIMSVCYREWKPFVLSLNRTMQTHVAGRETRLRHSLTHSFMWHKSQCLDLLQLSDLLSDEDSSDFYQIWVDWLCINIYIIACSCYFSALVCREKKCITSLICQHLSTCMN